MRPLHRSTRFKFEYCDKVRALASESELGLCRWQLAQKLGVTTDTIGSWMEHFPEFREAMIEARKVSFTYLNNRIKSLTATVTMLRAENRMLREKLRPRE